jgi:ParG
MAKVNRRSPWDDDQPATAEQSTPQTPAKMPSLTKVAPASGASRRINFDVDDSLHRRIRVKAASEGQTIAEVGRRLFDEWLEAKPNT